jgi:hypothetical protein
LQHSRLYCNSVALVEANPRILVRDEKTLLLPIPGQQTTTARCTKYGVDASLGLDLAAIQQSPTQSSCHIAHGGGHGLRAESG